MQKQYMKSHHRGPKHNQQFTNYGIKGNQRVPPCAYLVTHWLLGLLRMPVLSFRIALVLLFLRMLFISLVSFFLLLALDSQVLLHQLQGIPTMRFALLLLCASLLCRASLAQVVAEGEIKVELKDADEVAAACELRAQLAGVSIASGILLRPAVIRNATTEFSRKKSEEILAKGGAAAERASAAVNRVSGLDKANETAQKVRKAAAVAHHALEHVKEEVEIVAKKANEITELTAGATEHAKGAKANGDASVVKVSNLLARAKESEDQYVKKAAEECSNSTNYDVTAKSLAAALDKLPGVKEDNAVKTTFQSILTSLDNLDKDVKSVEQRAEELETALEKAERQLEKAEKAAEEAETESSKVETESSTSCPVAVSALLLMGTVAIYAGF
uniref:Uncharacterized protein n=1 Tax=Trypanosoma congolense (strain IL3000) TaxID=1068625 RepID=G0UVW6_TRYCI|nr:unnamed protein product [Trypanosoma congolense IL3000]